MTDKYFYTFDDHLREMIQTCLKNNLTDYKSCYEFHKFTESNLISQKIKERYATIDSMKPTIKTCIDNNVDKITCFYNKTNNNKYAIPLGYMHEFILMFDKMTENKENK